MKMIMMGANTQNFTTCQVVFFFFFFFFRSSGVLNTLCVLSNLILTRTLRGYILILQTKRKNIGGITKLPKITHQEIIKLGYRPKHCGFQVLLIITLYHILSESNDNFCFFLYKRYTFNFELSSSQTGIRMTPKFLAQIFLCIQASYQKPLNILFKKTDDPNVTCSKPNY